MRSRRTTRAIATLVLGALLFAQAALVIAACEWPGRSAAAAIARNAAPPCHEAQTRVDSLCVAHCLAEFQSLDKPTVSMPALPAAPVLEVRGVVPHLAAPGPCFARIVPPSVSPPPRILFHQFLI